MPNATLRVTIALLTLTASTGVSSATIRTVAGTGVIGFNGDGQPAIQAMLQYPWQVSVDPNGDVLIADYGNHRVRRVDALTGLISTVAGNGVHGYSGDGGPATLGALVGPYGIALDGAGGFLITDHHLAAIRHVDSSGIITTVFNGPFNTGLPLTMFRTDAGDLFLLDAYNQQIFLVDLVAASLTLVAGSGTNPPLGQNLGDGGPATEADFRGVAGFTVGASGDLLIADLSWNRIRRVDASTGIITTVAGGNGLSGFGGDGGPALDGIYRSPHGVAEDSQGNLFVADTENLQIRRIDAVTGILTTVAGNGTNGFSGDGGAARLASLDRPISLTFDSDGNLLVTTDSSIRLVPPLDLNSNSILAIAPNQVSDTRGRRGRMIRVKVSVANTSLCASPEVTLLGVSSNEPDDAPGDDDGNTRDDVQGAEIGKADFDFRVRAERSSSGAGRIYEADYLLTCGSGEQTVSSVFVTVPL